MFAALTSTKYAQLFYATGSWTKRMTKSIFGK